MSKETEKRSHYYVATFYFNEFKNEDKILTNKKYKRKLIKVIKYLKCNHFNFLRN